MKSNGLLKWLMIPAAVLVIFIVIKMVSGRGGSDGGFNDGTRLTAEEMKALGIEGDSPRDTVATLVGQVKLMRSELQKTMTENKNQQAENQRLRQRENEVDKRIQQALKAEQDKQRAEREQLEIEQQNTNSLLNDLQQRLNSLNNRNNDLPIGLGLEPDDGKNIGTMQWVEPSDAIQEEKNRNSNFQTRYPTSFGNVEDSLSNSGEKIRHEDYNDPNKPVPKPVYTVAANSTLMGSVAMTALIGRVPIDGTVNDPYPFKVLIGSDNLAANGIDLPDVSGAVLTGTASGDWTLSCVRGQIQSMTFVFNDGTIRTIPEPSKGSKQSENLGWISDPYGIPCVSGDRRSNAEQYLTSRSLITAAGAAAASLIKTDDGTVSSISSDGTISKTGISGSDAMGQILMGGVKDVASWVNKLYGEAFAAIYVKPGASVAVHIDQEIAIDYDTIGRKVNHNQGVQHANELD
ncbi:TIGR03752 family integrating conjugative element protein [Zophobihabitans entericus]|uniref:TIGR03752 family integrating conjugative element protein n=1 Tax=Zophobihabitans entericus TaxID=1635327 RepID=A0A6G9IB56_9GAMM|nr:TIGR03752 family integrating conjugative element protein [Zophobihabitans entericus]QIQ21461.1 TIGR03752 family integrating conjugative element protein [Zophobihabitans entericus]